MQGSDQALSASLVAGTACKCFKQPLVWCFERTSGLVTSHSCKILLSTCMQVSWHNVVTCCGLLAVPLVPRWLPCCNVPRADVQVAPPRVTCGCRSMLTCQICHSYLRSKQGPALPTQTLNFKPDLNLDPCIAPAALRWQGLLTADSYLQQSMRQVKQQHPFCSCACQQ